MRKTDNEDKVGNIVGKAMQRCRRGDAIAAKQKRRCRQLHAGTAMRKRRCRQGDADNEYSCSQTAAMKPIGPLKSSLLAARTYSSRCLHCPLRFQTQSFKQWLLFATACEKADNEDNVKIRRNAKSGQCRQNGPAMQWKTDNEDKIHPRRRRHGDTGNNGEAVPMQPRRCRQQR